MDVHELRPALDAQRRAFRADGFPDLATRIDRLDRLVAMLLAYDERIVETLAADFGGRSRYATRSGDVAGGVAAVLHHRDSLESWMRPVPIALPPAVEAAGARAEVRHEPLGVVGAIVPWNGPVLMACLAAAGILAAGNRMMLKLPELTPLTSSLIAEMFAAYFDPAEVTTVEGDAALGAAFTALPFDHLLFTGSTAIARRVMRAAAENLVPVTLELGGKNPAIVGRGADLELAAARLATGKMASAGQVCVAPDYVFTPRGTAPALRHALARHAAQLYPTLSANDDYTAIVSERHFERLVALLDDARRKGAQVTEVNPTGEPVWTDGARKFPLVLLTGATPEMTLMQEEIFGPILPILEYADLAEALDAIAQGASPLSAYYFGEDAQERQAVLEGVKAGNMVVNDVRAQLFHEQLPFGGVGASGMGRYRGHEGFKTFSNPKTVLYQTSAEAPLAAFRPPYGDPARAALEQRIAALKAAAPAARPAGRR